MKKSIAIMLLVATSVVAIAVGIGIWYTRPSAPLAIIEEAKARQRQPLLEVTPPQRAEVVPLPPDYQPLIDELLPLLQDELTQSKALSLEQQAYVDQAVENLRRELLQSIDSQANRTYVDQQITSLKNELTTSLGRLEEKQVDRRAIIDSITADDLRPAFSVFRDELLNQVRSEQPRTTVVMTGEVDEELLFKNLAWEIENNLDFYASYARDAILSTIDDDHMIALYESHRPMLLADLAASLPAPMTVIAAEPITGEQVLSELTREIENNKEFYATYARDAILDTISEDDLFSYYNRYRPLLLGDLYQGIKDEAKVEIADYADIIEQMEANREYYLAQDRKALPGVLTEADILPLYATYRDDLAEDLFTLLGEEIESNKDAYAVEARDAILETISDDDLIAYYMQYRPALVADLVEELPAARAALDREQILDDLYAEIETNKPLYAAYVRDALLETMIGDPEFDQVYEENRVDIDAVLLALGEEIENNKKFYATYVRNALLDTISGEELVNLYLNYRDALIEVGVELDANQIMGILTNEIESNREAYATWARKAIIDTMSDEELISYYLHYRPELLEDIYQGLKDRFAMASSAPVPSSPLPATQRTVILQEAVEEEAAPPVVVPPSPSPAVQRTVILQEVVEEEAAPSVVVEEKQAPPAPRVPVSPSVTTKPTTVPYEMTPAEYETLRQEKRNEALDEILKKIG
ncbi:MAG TPA: hypothetical protein PLD69_08090 [Sphaerochaeta sp.]|nr:hypothetical protein [Sphaerochaeta sp.]HQB05876.1 hypothetical protein [Sphaerochaeta sp.]